MKRLFFVTSIFLVVFCSAGSKSQKPESNARVEVIDGVECIHNTKTPLYPDKKVTFVEDLSIDGESDGGDIIFFRPRLSLVDDNENIYITETQDQVIKVLDSDGKYIKTIGAKGSGPGEFQMVTYLAVTNDGELLVTDEQAARTSFFDSSGKFLKSFQWRKRYYGFHLIKSSSYITRERAYQGTRQFGFFYVKEIDFDGKEIRSYGEFMMPEPLIVRHGKSTTYTSKPFSPQSVFTGDQDRGWLYHCLNNKYIIEVYDISGKLFRKIDRPYEPVPFTRKDAEEYRMRYKSSPSEVLRNAVKAMEMPKVKTIVSRMRVDGEGNLWIRTNEEKTEKGKILTAFDIFDSDGYYFAKVWSEFYSYGFKKGKMYRMDTDQETGYKSLKRYKVVWE